MVQHQNYIFHLYNNKLNILKYIFICNKNKLCCSLLNYNYQYLNQLLYHKLYLLTF